MIFTFIPTPRTAAQAAYVTRIIARAETLVEDGYRVYDRGADLPDCESLQGLYFVHSPEGALYEVNTVNIAEEGCQCECFRKSHFCKHLCCCVMMEEDKKDAAQVEAFEAHEAQMQAWIECGYRPGY